PPPKGISDLYVNGRVSLDGDYYGSVTFTGNMDRDHSSLDLNGHTLFIDRGLYPYSPRAASIWGKGSITSNKNKIDIDIWGGSLIINSKIRDNRHKVGLRISSEGGPKYLEIGGDEANTFTGDVEVSHTGLILNKRDGVTAIEGNVFIKDNATLSFKSNYQLGRSSVVTLSMGGLYFSSMGGDIIQSFKQLIIDGLGVISFGVNGKVDSITKIYLDDLWVRSGREVNIFHWREGRDFILVKKTSKNLADTMKKIKFFGYDPSKLHLEDYNDEYWMINGAPEPATYGAGLMLGVLGLVCYRRRQRSSPHQ
ncbi:hypothetical protein, partial [Cephaloticoccus capnophilus]